MSIEEADSYSPTMSNGDIARDFDGFNEFLSTSTNLVLLPATNQIIELHTIIRDKTTNRSEFVFCADRLMRLVIEEALDRLPYTDTTVVTPTGCNYEGIDFSRGNCGISVCRSGEAMEVALRQCCRSIRIGKILINDVNNRVLYARFLPDIAKRRVLLLYPLLSTGTTVLKAISVLVDNGVKESHIFLLSVFATPKSIKEISNRFPFVTIFTSEINTSIPHYFTTKYFGTGYL